MNNLTLPAGDAAQVLGALGNLKEIVALSIIACSAVIILVWLFFRHRDRQADARSQAEAVQRTEAATARSEVAKNERAKLMRGAWEKLADEVAGMRTDLQRQHHASGGMVSSVKTLTGSISELHAAIRDVAARQSGGINRSDSIRIIETAINDTLQREVVDVLLCSLRKNDYSNRAEYIQQRVKTLLGQSILRIADNLRDYRYLSVHPVCYLPYYCDETTHGVRFCVVDRIWMAIEPLYSAPHPQHGDDPRLEELRIKINSIFADLVSVGRTAAENIYADEAEVARKDPNGLFRAPADPASRNRRSAHCDTPLMLPICQ